VGEWTRGLVGEGEAGGSVKVQRWKGGKVDRKNKGTGGRVDWWERERQEAV
jgi:hypothetical protein